MCIKLRNLKLRFVLMYKVYQKKTVKKLKRNKDSFLVKLLKCTR